MMPTFKQSQLGDEFTGAVEFRLEGEPADLEWLRTSLHKDNPSLTEYDNAYFLRLSGFSGGNIHEARRLAREYMPALNGAASLIKNYLHLNLVDNEWYTIDHNGQRSRGLGGAELIVRVTVRAGAAYATSGSYEIELRKRLSTVLSACQGDSIEATKLRHILQIMSNPEPRWGELYLVRELTWSLLAAIGKDEGLTPEIRLFNETSYSWSALGKDARHGDRPGAKKKDVPPEEAMPYDDAVSTIRKYVNTLFEFMADQGKSVP